MRSKVCLVVVVFICVFGSVALSNPLVDADTTQCSDSTRSPTFGKSASKFVSGCEVYLFGEYLEPVEGPNGELGYLIEKTDSSVTINGRHFYSPYDPQRTRVRPPSEQTRRRSAVIMEAMEEIRRLAAPHPSREKSYYINNVLYTDEPQPYVTESGDTVMLQFHLESAHIVYEDSPLVFQLKPYQGPVISKKEQDKRGLDIIFHSLAGIRPGFIILIGEGYKFWYPLSEAPILKAALAKIPALALRKYNDMYGEWVYEMITIDGYQFHSSIISDFINK